MLEKFSKKIGFTQTEFTVILFFAVLFIIGFIYVEWIKGDEPESQYFDYSKQDSLFYLYSSGSSEISAEDTLLNSNLEIKKQVLELSDSISYARKETSSLTEKSININTADINELTRLPGIGEKTAEKIIDLRTKRGGFRKLEELMDVKGIGEVKFNKIKKFLYIK